MFTLSFGSIALAISAALVISFVVIFLKNLVEARGYFNGEIVHFYDLGPAAASSDYYADDEETEEEYVRAVTELNEYVAQKKMGLNPVLTDKIRDRFIPITLKSVFVFTVFHYLQMLGTVLFCILAIALVYGIVLVM